MLLIPHMKRKHGKCSSMENLKTNPHVKRTPVKQLHNQNHKILKTFLGSEQLTNIHIIF